MSDSNQNDEQTRKVSSYVLLNGKKVILKEKNLHAFCRVHFDIEKPCVVLLNGLMVPKTKWSDQKLQADDVVEVFSAIAGG